MVASPAHPTGAGEEPATEGPALQGNRAQDPSSAGHALSTGPHRPGLCCLLARELTVVAGTAKGAWIPLAMGLSGREESPRPSGLTAGGAGPRCPALRGRAWAPWLWLLDPQSCWWQRLLASGGEQARVRLRAAALQRHVVIYRSREGSAGRAVPWRLFMSLSSQSPLPPARLLPPSGTQHSVPFVLRPAL